MTLVAIHNVGSIGINRDLPPHLLPPEAWSDGKNVRFHDNQVLKFLGHSVVFNPPTVAPEWAMGVQTPTQFYWIYTSLTKAYTFQGGTHTDITRAVGGNYTGAATNFWNGTLLADIPVITNGVDDPQSWDPVSVGQRLVDLPNWPANTQCKIIRAFKNFLVAMYITQSSTVSPHMVKWSHQADPGAIPNSWDETDATKDTGEAELADVQAGVIQDAALLGDMLIIYKDNSTWGMQHIGGSFIFKFFQMFPTTGILTQGCVQPFADGAGHVLATRDDMIIHEGANPTSVLDRRWRRFLQNNMDPDNFKRSFMQINPSESEAWLCFPTVGQIRPDLALVWDWKENSIGVRELRDTAFIALGIIDDAGTPTAWASDAGAWDDDVEVWNLSPFKQQAQELLICDPVNTKFFRVDTTNQFNNVNMESFIERKGLAIVGVDREGNPKVDFSTRKLVKRLWPKMSGGPVTVRVGAQETADGPISYTASQVFTPGVDSYIDVIAQGRFLAVRFESNSNVAWALDGYDLEVEIIGRL